MLSKREVLAALAGVAGGVMTRSAFAAREQRKVARIHASEPKLEGAGVRVNRVIGHQGLRNLDPFVLLDRFASNDPRDYERGFPDHPHRGFETITVMLEGRVRHRDSVGNSGLIAGGGAQWMTAGRGIVHSEMPETSAAGISGFQFWLNLPAREKMRAPEYQDLTRAHIPQVGLSSGGSLSLIAGRALDTRGAVAERTTQPTLLSAWLEDDAPLTLRLEPEHTAFVFVHEGELFVGDDAVASGKLALLTRGDTLELRARNMRTGLVVAAARPIGEPIVQRGPFVMNTDAEIEQAFADYRSGALVKP